MGHVGDAMKKFGAEPPRDDGPRKPAPGQAGASAPAGSAPAPLGDQAVGTVAGLLDVQEKSVQRPTNNRIASSGFSGSLVAHHDRGGRVTEQYRVIRTNLMAKFPERRFCTMISSAQPHEGKTATTLNLGIILAETQEGRTVVLDGDLRKKTKESIATFLGVKGGPGVVDILRGQAKVKDVLRTTEYPGLDILTAGQAQASEIGDLLTRPELAELLCELRQRYNYVLIDTPPVNLFADATIIGHHVCGALLVVSMYNTRRESIRQSIRLLHAVNIDVLGMVLTKQRYVGEKYTYKYYS